MKKYLAECIGTFVLVFMGCGSAVFLGCDAAGGHLAVALAFGLSIVAMAYSIGGISGCHINPAVSLAMFLDKRLGASDLAAYIAAQCVGALIAALALQYLSATPGLDQLGGSLGSNGYAKVGVVGSLVTEIILTFIFIYTILGVTSDADKGSVAGIVIGLTLTFVHIVGIPLTGTSVNPARSFGPALIAGGQNLVQLWLFIVAPLIGSGIAVAVHKALRSR